MRVRDKHNDKYFYRGILTPFQMFVKNRIMLGRAVLLIDDQKYYKWTDGIPQLQLSSINNTSQDDLQYDQDIVINSLDIKFFLSQKNCMFSDVDGVFGKGVGNIGKYGSVPESIRLPDGLPKKEIEKKSFEIKKEEPFLRYSFTYSVANLEELEDSFSVKNMKEIHSKTVIKDFLRAEYYMSKDEKIIENMNYKGKYGLIKSLKNKFSIDRRDKYINEVINRFRENLNHGIIGCEKTKKKNLEKIEDFETGKLKNKSEPKQDKIMEKNIPKTFEFNEYQNVLDILDGIRPSNNFDRISRIPGNIYRVKYVTRSARL